MVCDGKVSVAGCLGYDVLDGKLYYETNHDQVSVAGCLGYDVLVNFSQLSQTRRLFQLLVV